MGRRIAAGRLVPCVDAGFLVAAQDAGHLLGDPLRNERQRLEEALALNKPPATAYYMKEDQRQLWSQTSKLCVGRNGQRRNRTADTWIFSPLSSECNN